MIIRDNKIITSIYLPLPLNKRIFTKLRLTERAFRLVPRGIRFIDDDIFVIAYNGAIFRGSIKSKTVEKEHVFRKGMSSPLVLESISNLEGFDDCVLYGEYFTNPNMLPTAIYTRSKQEKSEWIKRYEFEHGKVNHIHAIVQDNYRKGLIILTGDNDKGSGIWMIKNNFESIKCLAGGSQAYRACTAIPIPEGIVYATDTPLEQNFVSILKQEGEEWVSHNICPIPGPAVYSCYLNNKLFFSTTIEPDSRLSKIKKMMSIKLGPGIKDYYSYVICIDGNQIESCARIKKDFLPMGLFQFGSIQFPEQNTDILNAYVVGLRKYDGCWVEIGGKNDSNSI